MLRRPAVRYLPAILPQDAPLRYLPSPAYLLVMPLPTLWGWQRGVFDCFESGGVTSDGASTISCETTVPERILRLCGGVW